MVIEATPRRRFSIETAKKKLRINRNGSSFRKSCLEFPCSPRRSYETKATSSFPSMQSVEFSANDLHWVLAIVLLPYLEFSTGEGLRRFCSTLRFVSDVIECRIFFQLMWKRSSMKSVKKFLQNSAGDGTETIPTTNYSETGG